jgi:hypothetical protein
MIKYYKSHSGFRGVFWGTLSFLFLEFGMMLGLAGFDNRGIWDYGVLPYFSILLFIAISTVLFAVGIACKLETLKKNWFGFSYGYFYNNNNHYWL